MGQCTTMGVHALTRGQHTSIGWQCFQTATGAPPSLLSLLLSSRGIAHTAEWADSSCKGCMELLSVWPPAPGMCCITSPLQRNPAGLLSSPIFSIYPMHFCGATAPALSQEAAGFGHAHAWISLQILMLLCDDLGFILPKQGPKSTLLSLNSVKLITTGLMQDFNPCCNPSPSVPSNSYQAGPSLVTPPAKAAAAAEGWRGCKGSRRGCSQAQGAGIWHGAQKLCWPAALGQTLQNNLGLLVPRSHLLHDFLQRLQQSNLELTEGEAPSG